MNVFDIPNIVSATVVEALARLETIGDWGTAGPAEPATALELPHPPAPRWLDGWWTGAKHQPVHPKRIGGPIRACCTVVHTTDMLPGEWTALLKRWLEQPGDGACAHFGIGRSEAEGVVQWVPITRNGNHAGGERHGVYRTAAGQTFHPNTLAVGIELHCAGGVHLVDGAWRLVELGKAHGPALLASEVIPDPQHPGRGWHVVTDYQRAQLAALLDDLELVLGPMPAGLAAISTGEQVPSWGVPKSARVVGHVSLDPEHRSDPWPATMRWLNAR